MLTELFRRPKQPSPQLPPGIRIYAIGDVHGRADLVRDLLNRIDADLAAHPTARAIQIFLGDYVDRGPSSREVIDQLIARARGYELVCLKGNHEAYLMTFLKNPAVLDNWRHLGGLETLKSYGVAPAMRPDPATPLQVLGALKNAMPQSHRAFLRSLQLSFSCGDYFFAHAGIRPGVSLAKQREEDLLWIREDFLLCEEDFGKVIVHGHTPTVRPDIRPNRINIDTGAYLTGRLACLRLEHDTMSFI